MIDELVARAGRILDDGVAEEPMAPVTGTLHEIADGIRFVDAFSNVVAFDGGDGLVLFDTSLGFLTPKVLEGLRSWSADPIRTLVYTHGHVDHVTGAGVILRDAEDRGDPRPVIVGHEAVPERFERYELTRGHNDAVNRRQFGGGGAGLGAFPTGFVRPSVTYSDHLTLRSGDLTFELHHGLGETDDHTWAWVPERRAAVVGDFVIWVFPNAGNPQKVQRHPREWAQALRAIAARRPEILLPAHGLPVVGEARVARLLDDTAAALESLVEQTLTLMNAGARLDQIVRQVRVPAELADRPWLRPVYDEPEFVVRNIWRRYGGWWDGNPARLKPPADEAVAVETARLVGGADVLAERAVVVAGDGDLRLAAHLVELAALAAPDDVAVHAARADIYRARRDQELSLMAKGVFGQAAAESQAVVDDGGETVTGD
ncbi:MAG: alkyl sulfatase dimerization domain-containing protein [Acidimicrobiales bacterium]